jgi:hypothetical protein
VDRTGSGSGSCSLVGTDINAVAMELVLQQTLLEALLLKQTTLLTNYVAQDLFTSDPQQDRTPMWPSFTCYR